MRPTSNLSAPRSALAPVSTVLTKDEQMRVDAAGQGLYYTLHRESMEDVLRDLRQRRAGAVLVSVKRFGDRDCVPLARMVREFPRVPAMALLTHLEPDTLSRQGVSASQRS